MNVPTQLIKITPDQTGPYPTNSQLIDFHIRGQASEVDLANSEIILKMNVSSNETTLPGAVRPVGLGPDATTPPYNVKAFIRKAWIDFGTAGRVEEPQYFNYMSQNLDYYMKSQDDVMNGAVFSGALVRDEYGFRRSVFRDLKKLTEKDGTMTTMSTVETPELRIPLKELYGLADAVSEIPFPMMLAGDCNIHLELETNLPLVYSYTSPATLEYPCNSVASQAEDPRNVLTLDYLVVDPAQVNLWTGMPIQVLFARDQAGVPATIVWETRPVDISTATNGTYNITNQQLVPQGGGTTGQDLTVRVTVADGPNNNGLKYVEVEILNAGTGYESGQEFEVLGEHWGCPQGGPERLSVRIKSITGAAEQQPVNRIIESIDHDSENNFYSITLNQPLPENTHHGEDTWGNVRFRMLAADAAASWTCQDSYLVLHRLVLNRQQKERYMKNIRGMELPYFTFEHRGLNIQNFIVHNVEERLDPGSCNAMIVTPLANRLISTRDNASAWRFKLDTFDVTNDDVRPYGSLYYTQLINTIRNMPDRGGTRTKLVGNLDETIVFDARGANEAYDQDVMIISCPVPMLPQAQNLSNNIRFNPATTQKSAHLFIQKQKLLKFTAEGLQAMG